MSTHSVSMAAARVLLLVCAAVLSAHAQNACTYANTGYAAGVPYHLAVTYLTPGLSDWSISVPIPPPECANGYVSGEEALVCDFDVQPYVRIVDKGAILVHRNSWLRGYATVNVTVHCVFPRYAPPPPPLALPLSARPPSVPNRSKQKTTEATPTTKPSDTSRQSDEYTSSIEVTTTPSDESSSSSSTEEMEEPSTNDRVLRMKPPHFRLLPEELFDRFMTFLHGDSYIPLSRRGMFT